MDRRERMGDMTLLFQAALDGLQSRIWTALPGQYVSAGAKVGTANVQPTVQGRFLNQDGETWGPWVNLPVCQDCPISWPGGKRGRLVWPLEDGDEGIIVFASRCIDNWWLQGGPQAPAMIRMHDLSDGMFIPGIFSQAGAPVATTPPALMRLTSDDGLTYVELDDEGQMLSLVAPGGINLVGPISFNGVPAAAAAGVLTITGALAATGSVTAGQGGADQVGLQTHEHPTAAAGAPSPPTPGT